MKKDIILTLDYALQEPGFWLFILLAIGGICIAQPLFIFPMFFVVIMGAGVVQYIDQEAQKYLKEETEAKKP